jgi:putative ABC transport system substrate-binding protein
LNGYDITLGAGMKRRNFITLLSGAMATLPLAAHAQLTSKIARIGFLTTGSLDHAATQVALNAFHQGLREFGYVDGQNILIVIRAADSQTERFPALANELVELKVDLIVASNSPAGRAAQQATTTIPIVIPVMGDPIGEGLVADLLRQGRT